MADPATELIPPQGFHLLDVIILVAVLIGALQGFRHGLSGQLAHVISVVAMLVIGWHVLSPLSAAIAEITRLSEAHARPIAFLGACIVVLLAMALLRMLLKGVMELHFKPGFDRWVGLFAGAAKYGAIAVCILYVMMLSPSDYLSRLAGEESSVGRTLHRHLPVVQEQIDRISGRIQEGDPGEEEEAPGDAE